MSPSCACRQSPSGWRPAAPTASGPAVTCISLLTENAFSSEELQPGTALLRCSIGRSLGKAAATLPMCAKLKSTQRLP